MKTNRIHPTTLYQAWIEARLLTGYRVQTKDVVEFFGISRALATAALNEYLRLYPEQAVRTSDGKQLNVAPTCTPRILRGLDPAYAVKFMESMINKAEERAAALLAIGESEAAEG